MSPRNEIFSSSDALIFAALAGVPLAAGGCTLLQVIMGADFLDRCIPTREEVISALRILHRHGLVDCAKGVIGVTNHGREVYENGRRRRGGLFSIAENVRKALNSPRIKHPLVESPIKLGFISERSMEKAYREYEHMAQTKS